MDWPRVNTFALLFGVLIAAAVSGAAPRSAVAQRNITIPHDGYLLARAPLNAGEYRTALTAYRNAARNGFRSTEGLWIDSICFYTMIGESFYRAGELKQAMENYNAALQLFLTHQNWMLRVQFPAEIEPSSVAARAQITWGVSSRKASYANVPERMASLQGNFDAQNVIRQGGVLAPPQYFMVRVAEIIRCTFVAMSRRREIMGPTCKYDPLTTQLLTAFAGRPGPPNHWSSTWISLQLGVAYAAAGRITEAVAELKKSIQAADRFDHSLTPYALLELGKIAFEQEKFGDATAFLMEATYSAAVFDRFDVMQDAFRYAAISHMATNKATLFPPLPAAIDWAQKKGTATLHASLCVLATDSLTAIGQTKPAAEYAAIAERTIGRSDMAGGVIGIRHRYQQALIQYQSGNMAAGDAAFTAAMANQRDSSKGIYQIQLADALYTSGAVGPRIAEQLFTEVLRDPQVKDWALDPLEAFSILTVPSTLPMEHWFELSVLRKEQETALNITDRIRRRRFYSSLPFGGRLLSLRWLLESPRAVLSEAAQQQRQDLLVRYPAYAALHGQATALQDKLNALPAVPETDDQKKSQELLLSQLTTISVAQEAMLRDLALRREPSELTFPRVREFTKIQDQLGAKTAVLGFFATGRYVYAYWLTKENFQHWQIPRPADVTENLAALLRMMGHFDRNQPIAMEVVQSDKWAAHSAELFSLLLGDDPPVDWRQLDELVIIPDGVLWYVPFEALHVKHEGKLHPLFSLLRVRCAPLLSLAIPDGRGAKPKPRTGVVVGKLFPRESAEVGDVAMVNLNRVAPGAVRVPERLPAPSQAYSSVFDQLVVLNDFEDVASGPYDWSVMQVDKNKPGSRLSDWLALPWDGPEQFVLPGFQTAAASSLRQGGSGDEVFLTVCGLMATGARTILLSRWRVGGLSTHELVREFVQELPYLPASDAWQRSIELVRDQPFAPEEEPRIKAAAISEPLTLKHPFFWSGYLLIDTGLAPPKR